LPQAIASLERTRYADPVIVVDDGSSCEGHHAYLDRLENQGRYRVIRRERSGGISRAKNTCLRAIADGRAAIGFLAEDDILFQDGWDQAYCEAMRRSRIQHFSWYLPDENNRVVACNQALVTATAGLLGLLMTFTREALNTLGGFKVLPHRYGYEHIHWTYRAVLSGFAPFGADIVDSWNVVRRNSLPASLDEADSRAGVEENRVPGCQIQRIHEPFEE
jgi:glycosyltransferase involved in cell wall biosynthesis